MEQAKIYYTYNEWWMDNKYNIDSKIWELWASDFNSIELEDDDFYVFDTLYKSSPLSIPPSTIEPIITTKYRNRIVSRVYTGSQLIDYFREYQLIT